MFSSGGLTIDGLDNLRIPLGGVRSQSNLSKIANAEMQLSNLYYLGENMGSASCLYAVFFSSLLFNVVNKLVSVFFPPPKKLRFQVKKAWLWRNIAVSWVHSLITAVLSSYSLCKKPVMLEDMINPWTHLSYYAVVLSTGYFVYDLMNSVVNNLDKSLCIVIHHVIVISAFLISLFSKRYMYIPFCLVALLMEISSVFLHSRRLMRMSDVGLASLPYKINSILLIITFVIFRLLTCGWMLNFLVVNRHRVPTMHFAFGTCGMCVLIPQNIFLLKQIWRRDSQSHAESQRENEKGEKDVNANSMTKFKQFLRTIIAHGSD